MRVLCIFSSLFLIHFISFGQSKKELKAQLDDLTQKTLEEKIITDSILSLHTSLILELKKEISDLQQLTSALSDTLTSKITTLVEKQNEFEKFQNATLKMGNRICMREPDLSQLESAEPVAIYLKVLIDENGIVADVVNDDQRTTTKDTTLLEQVISLVRKDLIYSREPGASLLQSSYLVRIGPKTSDE